MEIKIERPEIRSLLKKFYFMCMIVCLHVCISRTCMPGASRIQKRTLVPLEHELQMVILPYGFWELNSDTVGTKSHPVIKKLLVNDCFGEREKSFFFNEVSLGTSTTPHESLMLRSSWPTQSSL